MSETERRTIGKFRLARKPEPETEGQHLYSRSVGNTLTPAPASASDKREKYARQRVMNADRKTWTEPIAHQSVYIVSTCLSME